MSNGKPSYGYKQIVFQRLKLIQHAELSTVIGGLRVPAQFAGKVIGSTSFEINSKYRKNQIGFPETRNFKYSPTHSLSDEESSLAWCR